MKRIALTLIACGALSPLYAQDHEELVEERRLLADAGGQETDLWTMGGDRHCFGQYRSVVMPRMANWLMDKLPAEEADD